MAEEAKMAILITAVGIIAIGIGLIFKHNEKKKD